MVHETLAVDHSTTPTPTARIAARAIDLRKVYGEGDASVAALDGVSIDFVAGEFTAIMGPSGSGKSTLMHCIAGLDTLTSGPVFLGDGRELASLDDRAHQRCAATGWASYSRPTTSFRRCPPRRTSAAARLAGRKADQTWCDTVSTRWVSADRLHTGRTSSPAASNRGRVCPGAPMSRPEVIFADEPTGNLDSTSRRSSCVPPPRGRRLGQTW